MDDCTQLESKFGKFRKMSRLGECEVCNDEKAKYTCPKCEVKTCSLTCSRIHKKKLDCTGIRVKTQFIPLKNMTEQDFLNDYTFLEECTRYGESRKRDKIKHFTRCNNQSSNFNALRNAANKRGTILTFLLDNFTKHMANTTRFDEEKNLIFWHIEWVFTNAGNLKYSDSNCSENEKLSELLKKYLDPQKSDYVPEKNNLKFYHSKGIARLKILLKVEDVKEGRQKYYLLDSKQTLRANLVGKKIFEFPCIYVCYDDSSVLYNKIETDN